MSNLFDDLARTLATPMPRRRALRLLGGAVVGATLPGLHARPALAHRKATCPSGTELCTNGKGSEVCMPAGGTCCIFPDIIVGCRPGYRCGDSRNAPCICDGEEDAGECVRCAKAHQCGKSCCKKTEFCASPKRGLCCKNGENSCLVLPTPGSGRAAGKGICCPSGTQCCANDQRTACCGPSQRCRSGKCTCPDGTQRCGTQCCPKGKTCSNGKCCPPNRKNCGDDFCCGANGTLCSHGKCCPKGMVNCGGKGKCCASVDCCGGTCCQGETVCANGTCCPPGRGFGSGKNARCCPPGTVPSAGGTCCPKNDPECCSDGEVAVICQKGKTCVEGACVQL